MTFFYDAFMKLVLAGDLRLKHDDVRYMLATSSYVPDRKHTSRADVGDAEARGEGYEAGGKALVNKRFTGSGGSAEMRADNVVWRHASVKARFGILFKRAGFGVSANRDRLIYCCDFGSDKETVDDTFAIRWRDGIVFSLGGEVEGGSGSAASATAARAPAPIVQAAAKVTAPGPRN